MRRNLTDDELAAIAWAEPSESARAIADRTGVHVDTVRTARARLREHGLSSRIYWRFCEWCGQAIAGQHQNQRYHDRCAPEVKRAHNLEREARPEVRATRNAYKLAKPDLITAQLKRLDERLRIAQQATLQTATRQHTRWTAEEDELVRDADTRVKLEAVAIALNRTFIAVKGRRIKLAKALHPQTS